MTDFKSQATVSGPWQDAWREELIALYRAWATTPLAAPQSFARRRAGREALAEMGFISGSAPVGRRKRCNFASQFRAVGTQKHRNRA